MRGPALRSLVEAGAGELALCAESDLAVIPSEAYPGARLLACRPPLLAAARARKRPARLEAPAARLAPPAAAPRREPRRLQGAGQSGQRGRAGSGTSTLAKPCPWAIDADGVFTDQRAAAALAAAARRDGLSMLRPSRPPSALDGPGTARASKWLSVVARACRRLKTAALKVRPVSPHPPPRAAPPAACACSPPPSKGPGARE